MVQTVRTGPTCPPLSTLRGHWWVSRDRSRLSRTWSLRVTNQGNISTLCRVILIVDVPRGWQVESGALVYRSRAMLEAILAQKHFSVCQFSLHNRVLKTSSKIQPDSSETSYIKLHNDPHGRGARFDHRQVVERDGFVVACAYLNYFKVDEGYPSFHTTLLCNKGCREWR